jgi:hypothetical protein
MTQTHDDILTLPSDIAASLSQHSSPPPRAFRAITKAGPLCQDGCLAPGSSPHAHSIITGWLIVYENSILELDREGMGVRDSMLHPFPDTITTEA